MQPQLPSSEVSVDVLGIQIDEVRGRVFLAECEWPIGLQNYVLSTVMKTPYRFFICDNSGDFIRSPHGIIISRTNQAAWIPKMAST